MRVLFFGDVVGRNARDDLIAKIPSLRTSLKADAIIINVENAAAGFGVTPQICNDFYKTGVDCLTTGNHIWDQREIISYIDKDTKLLRPINYPPGTPGRGSTIIQTAGQKKILVVNAMARLFMDALDDPFAAMDKLCNTYRIGHEVDAIFLDFHGEATSEKMAMAHFLDGRISAIIGTHTHIPTADAQILPKGTGYQTDAGMCGSYSSVVGMSPQEAISKFVRKVPYGRLSPDDGPVTLCGTMTDIDDNTGLCTAIFPLRIGGCLQPSMPKELL